MRLVYLAVPIDNSGGPRDQWRVLCTEMAAVLARIPGTALFRPDQLWQVRTDHTGPDSRLEQLNRYALDLSDVLIAVLPERVPSIGVPREIESAVNQGIPVAVLHGGNPSFSLTDCDVFELNDKGVAAVAGWVQRQSTVAPSADPTKQLLYFSPMPELETGSAVALPSISNKGDAGMDLYVSQDTSILPRSFVDIPHGIRVAFPPGIWGRLTGRSSTLRTRGLLVNEAVLDTGYRGELFTGVWNLTDKTVIVKTGERIAQLVPQFNVASGFQAVWIDNAGFDEIPTIDSRGVLGMGSSGM